jgi:hypothetical protein
MYERERYFRDLDREQWRDLLHSKGLHTRQELKEQKRNAVIHVLVKVAILIVLMLWSCDQHLCNSYTSRGNLIRQKHLYPFPGGCGPELPDPRDKIIDQTDFISTLILTPDNKKACNQLIIRLAW